MAIEEIIQIGKSFAGRSGARAREYDLHSHEDDEPTGRSAEIDRLFLNFSADRETIEFNPARGASRRTFRGESFIRNKAKSAGLLDERSFYAAPEFFAKIHAVYYRAGLLKFRIILKIKYATNYQSTDRNRFNL